ncbi:MAG: hypothetical protein JRN62_03220 [Nitrososphaerota archaeon]|jgi:hypothetical protein|nr:hypothetical protein [Nitrososphaerota archaeon]MDG6948608.1 hypothetical protein [Nitrososphaerota archaeon]
MEERIMISATLNVGKSEMPGSRWHIGPDLNGLCGEPLGDIWDCGVMGEEVHVPVVRIGADTLVNNRLMLPGHIYENLCIGCLMVLCDRIFYDKQSPLVCPDHGDHLHTRVPDETTGHRMFCPSGGHLVEPVYGGLTDEHLALRAAGFRPDTIDGHYLAFPKDGRRRKEEKED